MKKLLILGTGGLGENTCLDFATLATVPVSVYVAGRDALKTARLAAMCTARAASCGAPVAFSPLQIDWTSERSIGEVLQHAKPDIVFLCASLQSAQTLGDGSDWSALVGAAGYGMTTPLHFVLADRLGRQLNEQDLSPTFINGCYPDVLNAVLCGLGHSVLCGIGNVDIVRAAVLAGERDLRPEAERVRVLAHHYHITLAADPSAEYLAPRVWVDDEEVSISTNWRDQVKHMLDNNINLMAGLSAARILCQLVAGLPTRLHVSAPNGRVGGYPVLLREGALSLDLPSNLSELEAGAWQQTLSSLDGATVTKGQFQFDPKRISLMRQVWRDVRESYSVSDMPELAVSIEALRESLRA